MKNPSKRNKMLNLINKLNNFVFIFSIVFIFPIWSIASTEPVARVTVDGGDSSGGSGDTALPDLFSGAMSYQIPIEVPAGRNGMDPGIAIKYRSSNGNGWVGVGWDLELGSIQRAAKNGVNYSGDSYQLKSDSSVSDIVNVGNSEYLALVESKFSRIRKLIAVDNRPYWEITDKTGTRFFFGQSSGSRQDDPANAARIFKWCLDRIEDTNGNYMTISYTKDRGEIYPNQIDYTGNSTLGIATSNCVKFYLESRNDAPDLYKTDFKIKTAYRLKTIDILVANTRWKTYSFSYTTSANTYQSLLASMQPFGKDATITNGTVTAGTALPAMAFGAPTANNIFYNYSNWGSNPNPYSWNQFWRADVNGDGRTDIVYLNQGGTAINVKLSTGSGFTDITTWSTNPNPYSWNHFWLMDVNGDGKADLVYLNQSGTAIYVQLNTGNGFAPATSWSSNPNPYSWSSFWLVDVSGDGKPDLVYLSQSGSAVYVQLNTGTGFASAASWSPNPNPYSWGHFWLVDANGDGKTDILYLNQGGTFINVLLSTGSSFASATSWSPNPNPYSWSLFWRADVNGDGKMDILYLNQSGTSINVLLSTGSSFASATSWGPNPNPYSWSLFWRVDVNGDGKTDIVYLNQSGTSINALLSTGSSFASATSWSPNPNPYSWSQFWFEDVSGDGKNDILHLNSQGTELHVLKNLSQYDLLTRLTNGTGETVAVGYTPSTNYNNTQLPFNVQTVSSITNNDGNGNASTTNFTYSGGFFHIGERDFRGFNYAKVTGPVGPNGEQQISETWFHQGNDVDIDVNNPNVSVGYMKGKPYRTLITDASGNKYSETTMSYAPDTNGAPYFTPPYQVDSYTYDGDADYTQTRTIFSYDGYGNVVREDHYGDVNDSTDDSTIDRTIVRTFSPNTSSWIIGLPASEDIYEGIGTANKIAGKVYYYDDLTACNGSPTNNQTPVYGKLTRVTMWLNGGTNPEARMAYNSFGNLICQSDAKGNTTTIAYDTSNTFPTIVTNPLGQQTVNQYYGVDSIPADNGLYGQIKTVTDSNNALTASEYDVFGRKRKETLPDGTWTSMTYNDFGTVGTQNVRKDNSAGLWKATYFDGLGRTIKEKSSGPDQKTVVSDTIYNATGTVKQTSLPYFDGLETPRYQTYIYDPLGRVTRQNNPDATFNLACFNDGVTVKIDANGHKKREVRDVLGRLVNVQEYTGSFGTCTTDVGVPYATTQYTYDVLGKLRFLTDAKGNQTEMRYDTLGRKYYMKDPDMGVWSYIYDANSNLSTQIDAKGQTITFGYDALNRLITKHFPSGTDVTLTYDLTTSSYSKGRLSKMIDGSGSTIYNYDKMGRVISSNKTIAGVTYQQPSKSYVNGRLNSITYPDNETVNYGYDGAGNLISAGGYVSYSSFNALGQPRTATFGNGVVTTYQYDAVNNRLKSITTVKGASSLLSLVYGYDNFGNINGIGNVLNTTRSQAFTYDELNRLTQSINSAYGTFTYSYDQIGNILAKEGVGYTYGSRPHAVATLSSGKVYSYDANGNITSDGSRSITYDYDNMPTLIGNVSFTYDGNGSRVKKTSPGGTTIYVDKSYECTNGNCTKYIFAGEQRVALKSGSVVLYYHSDHLGGTSVVTDAVGILAEDIVYYPFGGTRSDDGPGTVITNVSHKYTGQELDGETGLYNYNARIYDPGLGRFLTPDTIVPDPSNPQSLNRYSYVMNNPLMYTDPSGHRGFWAHLWKSFVEAITHPNGGASVSVTYSTGGTTNVSPTNGASSTSGTSGSNGNSGSSSPSISINAGPSGSGGSLSSGSANSGMSINIYKNGGWVSADGINLQLINSFQKSEGSSSVGQLSLYLDNSAMGSNMATNGLTGGVSPQAPTTAADCHMGNRTGLMYPAPPSPLALGVSATLATQTWQFTFFPDFKLQQQWSTSLLGVSFDATVGNSGDLELGVGARNTGAGLNFYNGSLVGGSGHFGPSIPSSFVYGSVAPR